MTDTKDLIREIQEHTAAHGGENTATHLLVQAVMALQRQADEMAAIGAGGVSGPLLGGTLRTQAQPVGDDLRAAAQAVVERWDTPLWKDVPATAEYIGRLRAALAAQAPQPAIPAPHECKTEAEKKAYAFGWWKSLESNRAQAPQQAAPAECHHRPPCAECAALAKSRRRDEAAPQQEVQSYVHPESGMTADELWLECGKLRVQLRDIKDVVSQQEVQEPEMAYRAACHLATALFNKHYAHLPDYSSGGVVWGLCDSTAGVILQIDNMVATLVQPAPSGDAAPQQVAPAGGWIDDAGHIKWLEWRVRDLEAQRDAAKAAPQQAAQVASKAVLTAIRDANLQLVRTGDDAFMLVTLKQAAPQQEVQEPFGYVNTHTGQFFKDVEACRKNNEGHWRTVYTAQPAPSGDAEDAIEAAAKALAECTDYPWSHMPEQGRAEMRKHAQAVIDAARKEGNKP